MNRAQKRAKQKATPKHLRMTKEQRTQALIRNGITPRDLKQEYKKGYETGFRDAAPCVIQTEYAVICLALNKLHGFERELCADVLQCVDEHMLNSFTSVEVIEEVWEKIGLKINFDEPFERIEKA